MRVLLYAQRAMLRARRESDHSGEVEVEVVRQWLLDDRNASILQADLGLEHRPILYVGLLLGERLITPGRAADLMGLDGQERDDYLMASGSGF